MKHLLPIVFMALGALAVYLFWLQSQKPTATKQDKPVVGPAIYPQQNVVPDFILNPNKNPQVGV